MQCANKAALLLPVVQVWRHALSGMRSRDELLFTEHDCCCYVTLSRTKDWAYLLVNSLFGMVLFGIQAAPLRRHLPGGGRRQQTPTCIADHVATLLERAGKGPGDR